MKSSTSSNKKPEDNAKLLEKIRQIGSNKQCSDCGEKVIVTYYYILGYNNCCNKFWNLRLHQMFWSTSGSQFQSKKYRSCELY